MRNVRCPRCKMEHRLGADATGYTCSGCGTEWVFARCGQCHSTFHAPAGTATWTCRRCGFHNVTTTAEPVTPQPSAGRGGLGPAVSWWRRLSSRGRLAVVVVPLLTVA